MLSGRRRGHDVDQAPPRSVEDLVALITIVAGNPTFIAAAVP
jgi:hypothetical protein